MSSSGSYEMSSPPSNACLKKGCGTIMQKEKSKQQTKSTESQKAEKTKKTRSQLCIAKYQMKGKSNVNTKKVQKRDYIYMT